LIIFNVTSVAVVRQAHQPDGIVPRACRGVTHRWFDRLTQRSRSPSLSRGHQPWFDKLTNHGSTSSPTMVRQAHQPWFDKLTNHGSTGSPTVVRQAHQPWFDRLTNHGSTSSPTVVRQAHQPWFDRLTNRWFYRAAFDRISSYFSTTRSSEKTCASCRLDCLAASSSAGSLNHVRRAEAKPAVSSGSHR